MIEFTPKGFYCPAGDFFIDPRSKVERALITHAHSDHTRPGCASYLCAKPSVPLVQLRCAKSAIVEGIAFGEKHRIGDVSVSFHPAGHILGSAQIRVEGADGIWMVSGDHNATQNSRTCEPFEPVPCDVFITESTFALPIYRWPDESSVAKDINDWWRRCRSLGLTAVMAAYPLGKSQRLLDLLDPEIGPIAVHGNARHFNRIYRESGYPLPETLTLTEKNLSLLKGRGVIIMSSGAADSPLLSRLEPISEGFARGWMMIRKARQREGLNRGFILSDHSDWDGMMKAIRATGAQRIGVTHGQTEVFSRYLNENGWDAFVC
jgi:putative mRNA 3-end processing factor